MTTYHALVTWTKADGQSATRLHTVQATSLAKAAWAVEDECKDLPDNARTTMISEKGTR